MEVVDHLKAFLYGYPLSQPSERDGTLNLHPRFRTFEAELRLDPSSLAAGEDTNQPL